MTEPANPAIHRPARHVVVVGAGIGGLACALRLACAGVQVTLLERAAQPGGKMRTVASVAGPVDAGPTVLTMRHVFDDLFAAAGTRLEDHVTLRPLRTLARHYWPDGAMLDLMADPQASAANIDAAFGSRSVDQFRSFSDRAKRLFAAFDAPMMQAAQPSSGGLARAVLRRPSLIADMAPHRSLARLLSGSFDDPRLAQLFGRYATYVGGSPYAAPALLALIWQAEAAGVWCVDGGMHQLAVAIEALCRQHGVTFQYGTHVAAIHAGTPLRVETGAAEVTADAIVFNGDPRALTQGLLGKDPHNAIAQSAIEPRSLSANVLAFAATVSGPALAHHTVFFADDAKAEFDALDSGAVDTDSTLYICAQDRGDTETPQGPERLEVIQNAPPLMPGPGHADPDAGKRACLNTMETRLARFGVSITPMADTTALTRPAGFEAMFPGSLGSLYGRSPSGMMSGLMSGLMRPTARTRLPGLYLAGGGAHPGAGVPMATLSARHAAEAILADLTSR